MRCEVQAFVPLFFPSHVFQKLAWDACRRSPPSGETTQSCISFARWSGRRNAANERGRSCAAGGVWFSQDRRTRSKMAPPQLWPARAQRRRRRSLRKSGADSS